MLCWTIDVKWVHWGVCVCVILRWVLMLVCARCGFTEARISRRLWAGTHLSETQWSLQTTRLIPSPSSYVFLLRFSPRAFRADSRDTRTQCRWIRPISCPVLLVRGSLTGGLSASDRCERLCFQSQRVDQSLFITADTPACRLASVGRVQNQFLSKSSRSIHLFARSSSSAVSDVEAY